MTNCLDVSFSPPTRSFYIIQVVFVAKQFSKAYFVDDSLATVSCAIFSLLTVVVVMIVILTWHTPCDQSVARRGWTVIHTHSYRTAAAARGKRKFCLILEHRWIMEWQQEKENMRFCVFYGRVELGIARIKFVVVFICQSIYCSNVFWSVYKSSNPILSKI